VVAGLNGNVDLPIPSWLVVHPSGQTLLFDTGLHDDLVNGVSARYPLMARQFESRFNADNNVSARLENVHIDSSSVDKIVFSHLHFDHCGGTALVPNAQIIVQRAEWRSGHHPKLIEHEVYKPDDFDLGHDVLQIDGQHDIFGDGSVLCVPTPGHTSGHQSLRVNLTSGPVVLTGDCIYWQEVLEKMLLPPFGFDHEMQLDSMRRLKALQDEDGCKLLYGHDATQWATLQQSPSGII
jgi:glyoxylase-like metal-dependent hydrolase (beta-lactamase superfamily II)|tara:strand:+ start:1090 stop:1800 length:711 start_codon:yes stop_codon:yes gene_type:complete